MKIVWIEFNDDDEIFIITVDGVDCSIQEPRRFPSREWFSKKYNGPGLTYELGIAIHSNRLVWIKGPHRSGSGTDLTRYKAPNGLKSKIPAGKKVIADRIYKDPTCSVRNRLDSPQVKDFKRRARARHENFNGRLKIFEVLANKFRHGFQKHKECFEAVCVITQYELEHGHPLFDV